MRKFVIAMIAVFGVIALGLIILMVSVIGSGGISVSSSYSIAGVELVNTSNISMEGVSSLSLDYSSDDIYFFESDTQELILKEYMNFSPDEDELTQIKQSGSELRLRSGRIRHNWFFNHYSGYVEVYLPANYQGNISSITSSGNIVSDAALNLSDFAASSSSGDIRFNEVTASEVSASSTSGNIEFDIAVGNRSFSSSSGDIRIKGGNGDTTASSTSGNIIISKSAGKLTADASSGNITIAGAIGDKEIETTSGEIELSGCIGYVKASASSGDIIISDQGGAGTFESTSGNIRISFTDELSTSKEDIEASASSGNVELRLPSGLNFDFVAKTSSGDIDTSFDDSLSYKKDGDYASGTIGANPDFSIEIGTSSGNITVED
ncbi:MAG: hypothetical protein K0R34_191 [Herbinix sp.]|jgi:DUF4097 and DUF4098 domain-containing protein YvlB|nr:hypothetical protein [Herbinix sp.]